MTSRELTRLMLAQVCVHSAMTGSRLASPLLALKLGYQPAQIGVLLALFALSPVFLALPAGRLADRRGLHLPLALAVGAATLGTALSAIWPVFGVLCLGSMLTGAAAGTAQIALQRHVGRSAENPAQLKTVFSWLGIAPAGANFLGPLLAGLLIDHVGAQPGSETGFRAAYLFLAMLSLACWLLARRAQALPPLDPPVSPRNSVWDLLALPPLRRLLLINWMQSAAWDVHTFALPLLGHERALSASAIGALMGAFAIAAVLVRMVLPRIAEWLAEWRVILGATLIAAAALALYPLASGFYSMGLCSVVLGVTLGAVQPMILSLLHHVAPPARQGEAMALRVMTINLSSFLMPMVLGAVGAVIGVGGLFWLVAGILGAGSRAVPPLRHIDAKRLPPLG
jgi:MFS family permease